MSKTKADKLIEILDPTESRRSKWLLAVDEDIHSFKSYLEGLGFRVLSFEKGIKEDDLDPLLPKAGVDFFITKNGQYYFWKCLETPILPMSQSGVEWDSNSLRNFLDKFRVTDVVSDSLEHEDRTFPVTSVGHL